MRLTVAFTHKDKKMDYVMLGCAWQRPLSHQLQTQEFLCLSGKQLGSPVPHSVIRI